MNILIYSPAFLPSVGGLEFMAKMLTEELQKRGHRVVLVTTTEGSSGEALEANVVRRPSPLQLVRLTGDADVVLHMNLSLKGLWPLLFVRRPLVVGHYGPYRRADGRLGVRDRLKYRLTRLATNIACSETVRRDLPAQAVTIPNAYDDGLYRVVQQQRTRDVIFVGRFVTDKGVDLLLRSLVALRERGLSPSLTLVGLGPEEAPLRAYCNEQQLSAQVVFAGKRTGADAAALINQHRIMVVPSRNEGLPIAALDGVACGCILIGSDAGGLPEAIGECGLIFRNGDVDDLSRVLTRALTDDVLAERVRIARDAHLARFTRRAVADRYAEVIEATLARAVSS